MFLGLSVSYLRVVTLCSRLSLGLPVGHRVLESELGVQSSVVILTAVLLGANRKQLWVMLVMGQCSCLDLAFPSCFPLLISFPFERG